MSHGQLLLLLLLMSMLNELCHLLRLLLLLLLIQRARFLPPLRCPMLLDLLRQHLSLVPQPQLQPLLCRGF
jgi:hypothetical protein